MNKDYYEILGISRDADSKAIKSAYKELAKKYHPDVSTEVDAQERFQEISQAYEVLSKPEKRSQYDQMGHSYYEQNQSYGQGYQSSQNFYGGFGPGSFYTNIRPTNFSDLALWKKLLIGIGLFIGAIIFVFITIIVLIFRAIIAIFNSLFD